MSDQSLQKIEAAITARQIDESVFLRFPIPMSQMPQGWLNGTDMQILYSLAALVPGPILEVGSWLGRSTVAISAGIRDSGETKIFDTVDFGITSPSEWEALLKEDFARFGKDDVVARSIFQPGGSIGVMIENLRKAGLLPYVTSIIRGVSTKVPLRSSYSMVFCDTLHNEREVREYGDFLNNLIAPGGWLVCDDIIDEKLGVILNEYIDFDLYFYSNEINQYSKFFVGRKKDF